MDHSNTAWAREEAWRIAVLFVGVPDAVRGALANEIYASLVAAERKAKEECAKVARRGSDVSRGWIEEGSTQQTDQLLYSALREGQEIEKAIRSTLPPTSKAE